MIKLRQIAAGLTVGALFLAGGCASPPAAVPASAQLMTSGSTMATFRPTDSGRVYVVDENDHKIIYQAEVDRGEIVQVDSRKDRVEVAGRTVTEPALDDNHEYRIYFEPLPKERMTRYKVVEEKTTVHEHP